MENKNEIEEYLKELYGDYLTNKNQVASSVADIRNSMPYKETFDIRNIIISLNGKENADSFWIFDNTYIVECFDLTPPYKFNIYSPQILHFQQANQVEEGVYIIKFKVGNRDVDFTVKGEVMQMLFTYLRELHANH